MDLSHNKVYNNIKGIICHVSVHVSQRTVYPAGLESAFFCLSIR
ncbi:hypothetical protein SBF1_2530006 [Candidatus Desulfosporosinus infrequens]|uniref:Uncharacterized protein n=1 Tax=Candidatus Desulfosporosinus infrequens TaxID=2043169 RepID=A0A2U3KPE7_9FIRM|nr:hypothetical protein SBF1_2530006 [Candidatus Desulfosporosinus infrequens]